MPISELRLYRAALIAGASDEILEALQRAQDQNDLLRQGGDASYYVLDEDQVALLNVGELLDDEERELLRQGCLIRFAAADVLPEVDLRQRAAVSVALRDDDSYRWRPTVG